jgi:SAM-dependent methyltransferase
MNPLCSLCNNESEEFFEDKKRLFLKCKGCRAIFVDTLYLPDKPAEIKRYREHNNDVEDTGYQKFVNPVVNEIIADFGPLHTGLDFGAGPGPVISKLLADRNYQVKQYDPFFYNFPGLLELKYDYIVCCEVIEHFHKPAREFQLLRKMLGENGKLYCMTSIYNEKTDFKTWQYKNDPTHVFFYHKDTLNYISENFGFTSVKIENNLIVFSN